MEWTKEQRYRRYSEATKEELDQLRQKTLASTWRQTFHIQPMYGLLNDPNGFGWFNGKYHLFYQWFPLGPVHGLKHWYHVSSDDLVDWKSEGVALTPELAHEAHGIFSGSSYGTEEALYLFYTGNMRDAEWERHSSQCLAILDKAGNITKQKMPLIPKPPVGYTNNFRDPKVLQYEQAYYMLVGAQREDQVGCILVYQSDDLKTWSFKGELKTSLQNFGFMWECPDMFSIGEQDVLLFSPQGLKPNGVNYHNIYHSGVCIGNFLPEELCFQTTAFQELDCGFDFYAPQTTKAPDGRQLLIGWMGLPDISYPSDKDMWANCLTIPRELTIRKNRLWQQPIRELKNLRGAKKQVSCQIDNTTVSVDNEFGHAYELCVAIQRKTALQAGIALRVGQKEETVVLIDWEQKKVKLDRTNSGLPVAEEYGTIREAIYAAETIQFQIFMDTSSIEVFVNDGELVFSSRIFPSDSSQGIQLFTLGGSGEFQVNQWKLRANGMAD